MGNTDLETKYKIIRKTKFHAILAKIYPLLINHKLQNFLTTNLLLPSLAFEDSTLELKFMENLSFPQFKLPVTYEVHKTLNLDTSRLETPRFVTVLL